MANQVEYVIKRIAELREELENLIDCLDLLETRVRNFRKPRYTTDQVKRILRLT